MVMVMIIAPPPPPPLEPKSVKYPGSRLFTYLRTLGTCSSVPSVYCKSGAACGLLGSRHLVVKITDFTDTHPIFKKIRALFYTQTPTGTAPAVSVPSVYCNCPKCEESPMRKYTKGSW